MKSTLAAAVLALATVSPVLACLKAPDSPAACAAAPATQATPAAERGTPPATSAKPAERPAKPARSAPAALLM